MVYVLSQSHENSITNCLSYRTKRQTNGQPKQQWRGSYHLCCRCILMSTVTSLLAGRGNLTSDETRCVHTHVTQRKWFRRASERATDGRPSRQRCAIRRSLSASVGCPDDEDVNDAHCRPADTQHAQRVLLVHVPSVSFCRPSPVYEPLFTMPLSLPSTTREGQYRYWKTFSFIWCIRVQHVKYDISIFRTDSMAGLPGPILLSISVFNFCFFCLSPTF